LAVVAIAVGPADAAAEAWLADHVRGAYSPNCPGHTAKKNQTDTPSLRHKAGAGLLGP
jgi:hypothetical protein